MIPFVTKLTATAAVTNAVCLAQQKVGAGNLTINGTLAVAGVATLNTNNFGTKVTIYSTGDLHGINFTIYGTGQYGNSISETLVGPNNATVTSLNYFATVTRVAVDASVSTNVILGNANATASPWFVPNRHQVANMGIGCQVGGTVNYTVQVTFDDVMNQATSAANQFVFSLPTSLTAQTTSKLDSILFPVGAVRVVLSSSGGAVTDFVKMTIIDSCLGPSF